MSGKSREIQNANLLKGNPDTEFKSDRRAVENGSKGGKKLGDNNRRKKTHAECLEAVLKIGEEAAIKEAEAEGDIRKLNMLKDGGILAAEQFNIAFDRNAKDEVRLKALDMIMDRKDGKPLQTNKNVNEDITPKAMVIRECDIERVKRDLDIEIDGE